MARKKIEQKQLNHQLKRGSRAYVFKSLWMRLIMTVIDFLGVLMVWLVTLGRGLNANQGNRISPDRILVVRLDHIGDVLFARPTLESLRSIYPKAHITLMVSSIGAELMRLDPAIDDLLIWDAPWFNRQIKFAHQKHYGKLIKAIRQMKVDLSLDLRGDLRHHIMLALAGVRYRIGQSITGGRFLLHQSIRLRPDVHEVERDLDVVRVLTKQRLPINYPPLALTIDELNKQRQLWATSKSRIVIHPAAGDIQKCWPRSFFIELCNQLAKHGCELILVGITEEKFIVDEIYQSMKSTEYVKDLSGLTTIRELAALITTADFFIGHDSGPAHMAITQSIPTIMLWSATNQPIEWGPWGEQTKAVVFDRSQQAESIKTITTMINKKKLEIPRT